LPYSIIPVGCLLVCSWFAFVFLLVFLCPPLDFLRCPANCCLLGFRLEAVFFATLRFRPCPCDPRLCTPNSSAKPSVWALPFGYGALSIVLACSTIPLFKSNLFKEFSICPVESLIFPGENALLGNMLNSLQGGSRHQSGRPVLKVVLVGLLKACKTTNEAFQKGNVVLERLSDHLKNSAGSGML